MLNRMEILPRLAYNSVNGEVAYLANGAGLLTASFLGKWQRKSATRPLVEGAIARKHQLLVITKA